MTELEPNHGIDLDLRPTRRSGVEAVQVGPELVVLDGWREATVLSPSGAEIWRRLDGATRLKTIAEELADAFAADLGTVTSDVVNVTWELALLGLVDGIETEIDESAPDITLVPAHVTSDAGEIIDDLELLDLSGETTSLLAGEAETLLLVNWSPHCGYCTSIVDVLSRLDAPLKASGVPEVLFAYGSAEASRTLAELSGWHPRVLLKPPDELGPFVGHGTPAAFHLDRHGTLLSPAARGTDEVVQLAATLAGVDLDDVRPNPPSDAKYLLDHGGSCAPGTGSEPIARWIGTRVYRIDGCHVGLRYTSEYTAEVLDELFHGDVVDDPAAGHIYAVALVGPSDATDAEANLLTLGSLVLVCSRFPERVVRALLWRLDDQMGGFATSPGRLRVNATAVLTPAGAALLQPGLFGLEEKLQPAFARHGIAFVDVVNPEIDLQTVELVVPEPRVRHDSNVLGTLSSTSVPGSDEPASVRPGRYPLVGWGVVHEAERAVTRLTPAQSTAATLSFALDTNDQLARTSELGDLFERIDGFGLWYHSESQLADAVAESLGLT